MAEQLAQEALWLQLWVGWLVVANLAALIFVVKSVEARWVVGLFILNALFMQWLYSQVGYVRLLGLSHVIFWTPLLIYLWKRRKFTYLSTWTGKYLYLVFITDGISLLVDYVDVARYLLGDGQLG